MLTVAMAEAGPLSRDKSLDRTKPSLRQSANHGEDERGGLRGQYMIGRPGARGPLQWPQAVETQTPDLIGRSRGPRQSLCSIPKATRDFLINIQQRNHTYSPGPLVFTMIVLQSSGSDAQEGETEIAAMLLYN